MKNAFYVAMVRYLQKLTSDVLNSKERYLKSGMKRRGRGMKIDEKQFDFQKRFSKGVLLVEAHVPWSAPCMIQNPIIEKLRCRFREKIIFVDIDIERNKKTALALQVRCIPTIILFRDGAEAKRWVGLQSEETLADYIESIL